MDSSMSEIQGKQLHDPCSRMEFARGVFVPVPIIVGAGPSGLAVAACLKQHGLSSVVIERSKCIASLWQLKTYDRLRLHLPKQFCELPLMKFPEEYPAYPTKQQFVEYLEAYAARFDINPKFNETVLQAVFDDILSMWKVTTRRKAGGDSVDEVTEYVSPWLIAATGENAEAALPEIEGLKEFDGDVRHTSLYRSGGEYEGKRVLVIGCGNSGMEVSLDLCNHGASPWMVVRDTVHVLPREMLGKSTFALSMWLLKWLPIQLVDHLLLALSRVIIGDTSALGLHRPSMGPLQLKNVAGKTPVLDMGTLDKIKSGEVKVAPGVKKITGNMVEFFNDETESFDAIILATGYRSNVPRWLKEGEMFSERNGFPKRPFPNGWKGNNGLYAAGFTKRGILGASMDAQRVAEDIKQCWSCMNKF